MRSIIWDVCGKSLCSRYIGSGTSQTHTVPVERPGPSLTSVSPGTRAGTASVPGNPSSVWGGPTAWTGLDEGGDGLSHISVCRAHHEVQPMTVDQLPSLKGTFPGGCQCKGQQPCFGVQHVIAASSQRADGGYSGRIGAGTRQVQVTALQRTGDRANTVLLGRGPLGPGTGTQHTLMLLPSLVSL